MKKLLISFVLFYLRLAAKIQIAKIKPKIIGIAGSSGKSSLTSLVAGILSEKYSVKQSLGKNSETGLPLDILGIHMTDFSPAAWLGAMLLVPIKLLVNWTRYDMYIAEMGIDSPVEPKNMSYLLKIIQPTIGVVTNVSLEHSVYFEPYVTEVNPLVKEKKVLDLTAEQEMLLLTSMSSDDIAIVNRDDTQISNRQNQIDAKQITISLEKDANLVGKAISSDLSRFTMQVVYKQREYPLTISQPLPKHFAYEFLFAIGIGLSQDIVIENAIDLLEKHFSLPSGRLSFFKGIKNTVLIDSTYNNATLPPILDILDFVKEISGKRRKIAILGDMRELGEEAQNIHEEVARKILTTVDFVILIGPLSEQYMVPILEKANFPYENFPDVASSKKAILDRVEEGDVILAKGSQNTLFLERIVEILLAEKDDIKKLTRRGDFWDKKRSESL